MVRLGRLLRWWFGILALLFAAIFILYLVNAPSILLRGSHTRYAVLLWLGGSILIGLALISTTVFSMAWWTLGKGTPSARAWAIAASLLDLSLTAISPRQMLFCAASGVAGLVVFSRRQNVAEMPVTISQRARLRGDGTNSVTEIAFLTVSIGTIWMTSNWWRRWGEAQGLPTDGMLPDLIQIGAASILVTTIHEMGHVFAGWALGMKVRRLVLGPVEWWHRGGKWMPRFQPAGFFTLGGGAGLVPVTLHDLRWRLMIVTAAGPVVSFWLGAAAIWAAFNAKGQPWEGTWNILTMIASFSLVSFVANLIPIRFKSLYSDGAHIYQLLRNGPWRDFHLAASMVTSSLVAPLRPRDYDIEMIQRAVAFFTRGRSAVLLRLWSYQYFFDSGRIPEAIQSIADAEAVYEQSPSEIPGDLCAEFAFANAFLERDAAGARLWWERMHAKQGAQDNVDFWRARCALLWIHNRIEEGREAWEQANTLAEQFPKAGAYEFERWCLAQLREVLDTKVPPPVTEE